MHFVLIFTVCKIMVIMGKTVLVFASQTAGHVNLLTAHVDVMLVGWDLTVVLVFA